MKIKKDKDNSVMWVQQGVKEEQREEHTIAGHL